MSETPENGIEIFNPLEKESQMVKKKTTRKGPQKKCPKCGTKVHARKNQCDKCDYSFLDSRKKKAAGKKFALGLGRDVRTLLLQEREKLQKRIDAIDVLLED